MVDESRECKEAYDRYEIISNLLENDENGRKLLKALIVSVINYVDIVVKMEEFMDSQRRVNEENKFKMDEDEYKEKINSFDSRRRMKHEALISNLNALNRYLFRNYEGVAPIGGIYSLEPSSMKDRNAVSDWAGHLARALYRRHIL